MYSSELSGVEMYTFTYMYIHRSMHLESGLKSKCPMYTGHRYRYRYRYTQDPGKVRLINSMKSYLGRSLLVIIKVKIS